MTVETTLFQPQIRRRLTGAALALGLCVAALPAMAQTAAPADGSAADHSAPALSSPTVSAAAAKQGTYGQLHKAFAEFEKQGGFIDYLGREGSLDGFTLVTPDQQLKTIYLTPDGYLVMGILLDKNGDNATARQLAAYRARLDGGQQALPGAEKATTVSKAEQVYATVENAGWVRVGREDAPYIYMFVNANCDHCKAMFKDLQPAVKTGQLQIRLVPFGSADANRTGGAALLSVDDPGAAWLQYINGDTAALGADKIKPGAADKLAANTQLVKDQGIKGPPFTLYRRPADGIITGIVGRPANIMALMADLLPPAPMQKPDTPTEPVQEQPQAEPQGGQP